MVYHSTPVHPPIKQLLNMSRPGKAFSLIVTLLFLLQAGAAIAQVTPAAGQAPKVVTSIKPLQLIVSAITDGITTPELLIPANQSYHHYTLRPSAVRTINQADLVVWVGPALETYLSTLLGRTETTGSTVRALTLSGLLLHPLSPAAVTSSEVEHEHNDDHSIDNRSGAAHSGAGHADDSHQHGTIDAHVWLDTDNAKLIADAVAQQLQIIDPTNSARYVANLTRFNQAVDAMKLSNRESLAPLKDEGFAVYHNAFQYFEKQNGLQHQLVFVNDEEMQPGVRHILAVREALQKSNPVCLLEDVTTNPATVNTVLGDYNIIRMRADVLGETLQPGQGAYVQLMENLAAVFQRCLTTD